MKSLQLTGIQSKGRYAIIDERDSDLTSIRWRVKSESCGYEQICGQIRIRPNCWKQVSMGRFVWARHNGPIPDGYHIDHINRNTFDNRVSNLRLATRSQNLHNRKLNKNNSSGFKGVPFRKGTKKWSSYCSDNGVILCLGDYEDREIAARIYDSVAIQLFDEFALTNYPRSDYEGLEIER